MKPLSKSVKESKTDNISDEFPLHVWQTGSGTQTNMDANEVISMLGNEYAKENILHPNDTVNASQSSNDTFPAALHIMVAQKINAELLPQLDLMIHQIKKLEEENEGIIKIGRTPSSRRHSIIFLTRIKWIPFYD